MNKNMFFMPDWGLAPEWANYVAQDKTGWWYWFANKPRINEDEWETTENHYVNTKGEAIIHNDGFLISGWKEYLSERPIEYKI